MKRTRLLIVCLPVVLVIIWVAYTASGRAGSRAAMLVQDLLSGADRSLLHVLTRPATAETISIPFPAGPLEAQLYHPPGLGTHSALILVLGYPSNIDDPQLGRVADDLARLGVAALVPRLPHLRAGELDQQDVEALVTAFEWVASRPDVAPTMSVLPVFAWAARWR